MVTCHPSSIFLRNTLEYRHYYICFRKAKKLLEKNIVESSPSILNITRSHLFNSSRTKKINNYRARQWLNERVLSFPPSSSSATAASLLIGREVDANRHFSSEGQTTDKKTGDNESSDPKEVISTSSKEPKHSKSLFSWKPFKRGLWRSRNTDHHFAPSLFGTNLSSISC